MELRQWRCGKDTAPLRKAGSGSIVARLRQREIWFFASRIARVSRSVRRKRSCSRKATMGAVKTFLLGLSTLATALGGAYFIVPDVVNSFIVGKDDAARAVLASFSVLLGAAFIGLAGVLCTISKAANAAVMK
jgi:hypothetical protein